MKKIYQNALLLIIALLCSQSMMAQPPIAFLVNSPISSSTGPDDYGEPVDFGPMPLVTMELNGDLAWGYGPSADGTTTDSLGCMPLDTDLTGKFALIRRGGCGFSLKIYNAQEAGAAACIICNHLNQDPPDGNEIVGMLGGDSINAVTIPAIFLSFNQCDQFLSYVDAGDAVNVSLKPQTFYDPVAAYAYHTPLEQVFTYENIEVNLVNADVAAVTGVEVTATVTDPSGNATPLTTIVDLEAGQDSIVTLPPYDPTELGEYTVNYTNTLNSDVLERKFVITDYTFAHDNGNVDGGIGPSEEQFAEAALKYQTGALYFPGENGGVATHATFGISNAAAVYTGDAESDVIRVRVFQADADGDGQVDLASSFTDLENNVVGFVDYVMTGQEGADQLLVVEFDEPVQLDADGAYYLYLGYDGTLAGSGVSVDFLRTSNELYVGNYTPLELDALYSGWNGSTIVNRLNLDGFDPTSVGFEAVALDKNQVNVFPNPAQEFVSMNITLNDLAEEVIVRITNTSGQLVESKTINNVQEGTYNFNTSSYAAGTYFMNVYTPEGFRSKVFVVAK